MGCAVTYLQTKTLNTNRDKSTITTDSSGDHRSSKLPILNQMSKSLLESFKMATSEKGVWDHQHAIDHQPVLINSTFMAPNILKAPSMRRKISSVSIVVGDQNHSRSFTIQAESYNQEPLHPTTSQRNITATEAQILFKLKSSVEKRNHSLDHTDQSLL